MRILCAGALTVLVLAGVPAVTGCSEGFECTTYTCQEEWDFGGDARYDVCIACDSSSCDHELRVDGEVIFDCSGGDPCTEARIEAEYNYCASR
jgi:hypothetical protein